jgi:uridine kinase
VPPLARILDLIDVARSDRDLVLVGIGGHGGAGKSTLARLLCDAVSDVQVVATDAFWDGSRFDLDRVRASILDELLAGHTASYEPWDWAAGEPSGATVTVEPRGVIVIDGVCALHQMFRQDLAVRVWVDAPADVRLERGVARDGEASRTTWVDVWMPNEAAYVARDRPVEAAHVVIDGTRPQREVPFDTDARIER